MGWYLRKSIRFGPLRLNLSKGGIGLSAGVKGARVGLRPNGRAYVHAGRHGLYVREELGTVHRSKGPRQKSAGITPSALPATTNDMRRYESVPAAHLVPKQREQLIGQLTFAHKAFRWDKACGWIALLGSCWMLLAVHPVAGILWGIIGLIAFYFARHWEAARRMVNIEYECSQEERGAYDGLRQSLNILASCSHLWATVSEQKLGSHHAKLNAGAGRMISRVPARVEAIRPRWVSTNVETSSLGARGQTWSFLPDGILVFDQSGVGFVEYSDLFLNTGEVQFVEPHPPADATVVAQTWKHPNRDGGPDRRFKSNHQIPVCGYGELRMQTRTGVDVTIQTSRRTAAQEFKHAFSVARESLQTAQERAKRFRVFGVDRASGFETEWITEADNGHSASRLAIARGIDVKRVELL